MNFGVKEEIFQKKVLIDKTAWEEKSHSMEFNLPGLTVCFYKYRPEKVEKTKENKQSVKAKSKA